MKVVFRVDASLQIGSGHVMRCLTLAIGLRANGASCQFICREHPGNLASAIRQRGFAVHLLPMGHSCSITQTVGPGTAWLGATLDQEIEDAALALAPLAADLLVVDHYSLDSTWEVRMRSLCRKVMVIDDLANRNHECELLLDQNLGRHRNDYLGLTPDTANLLVGPAYALLRTEFSMLREHAIPRRRAGELKRVMISLGGVDQDNITVDVLDALKRSSRNNLAITVVMGAAAPHIESVQRIAETMPWPTEVVVAVDDIAARMLNSDIAIGAAGSTSWERCCLGLPSIVLCLADNQKEVIQALVDAQVSRVISVCSLKSNGADALSQVIDEMASDLWVYAERSMKVIDGLGVNRVVKCIEALI